MKLCALPCLLAALLSGTAMAQTARTAVPPPHWSQLDNAHRKSVRQLLSEGYELKAAFTNSYEQEIAYLQKGASLYRCMIGGANLGLLTDNELLCAPFIEPYRAP